MKRKFRALLVLIVCAAMLYAGLTASPAVNVSAATPIKSTINMAKTKNVTVVKGNRYKMKAVIKKKNITTQGKWTSSNKKVATVAKNGVIKAIKAGKTTIKVTYKGKSLKTVVKVKAVCIHKWKTTKKATCKTAGKQTCTVCLKSETIPKTAHSYVSETAECVEGRGKAYNAITAYCGECGVDMTDWTKEQKEAHRYNTNNWDCFQSNITGVQGETRYPKYVMTRTTDEWCKNCGSIKPTVKKDLYECTGRGGQKLPAGIDLKTYKSYEYYCKTHGLEICPSCKLEKNGPDGTCLRCKNTKTATNSVANKANAVSAIR